jgi:hypothetical protein
MLKLAPGVRVGWLIERRFSKIDAISNAHGPTLTTEQRWSPAIEVEQSAHRQCNSLGFVSAGEPTGRRFYQRNNVGTVDRNHGYDNTLGVISLNDKNAYLKATTALPRRWTGSALLRRSCAKMSLGDQVRISAQTRDARSELPPRLDRFAAQASYQGRAVSAEDQAAIGGLAIMRERPPCRPVL